MHIDLDFQAHLEARFGAKFILSEILTGGDINSVFRLKSQHLSYVLKLNEAELYPDLFQKEANGLKELTTSKTIDVPKVFGYGEFDTQTYLLIEYKRSGIKKEGFWEDFGHQLADLHKMSQSTFGFKENNFIGSLPQFNEPEQTAADFLIQQRLKPQFQKAQQLGYDFEPLDAFFKTIKPLIPEESPALIHGDLWSGNYLINSKNQPCLIDPAVAYAPREMDLAMMKLFGGFDDKLFQAYHESFPLQSNMKNRIPLWQLYYVLVHVNLFGGGYYRQAQDIINRYL
ncbi:fructosamine kinase family protein [Psychroflexus tropicus]|uniref:fructosamine kinase family protein n=1 Tax=Psychroflexus tropicus TaxID=197345 RepID=UPI00035D9224|nr:fructosamine kinase family protein [Psychroflexus tropicus]